MNAHRDGLAHRFLARVMTETRAWPAELQVGLYELAFELPELVLALDAPAAVAWARRWRARTEAIASAASVQVAPEDEAWIAELAREWTAAHAAPAEASPAELERLATLFGRLGPLALALPWRADAPASA